MKPETTAPSEHNMREAHALANVGMMLRSEAIAQELQSRDDEAAKLVEAYRKVRVVIQNLASSHGFLLAANEMDEAIGAYEKRK